MAFIAKLLFSMFIRVPLYAAAMFGLVFFGLCSGQSQCWYFAAIVPGAILVLGLADMVLFTAPGSTRGRHLLILVLCILLECAAFWICLAMVWMN